MRPGQNDVYSIGVGVRCLEFLVPKKSTYFPENTPPLVHLNILITIPDLLQVACKLLFRNNHCRVVVVGWKLSDSYFVRLLSRKRYTWFSTSFISPKGDTEPGLIPKYFSMRAGDANVSLP